MQKIRLFEWQSIDFNKHQRLMPGLVRYLNEVWQSRNKFVEEAEDSQNDNTDVQRFFTFTGDGKLIARNYVGVVQYEDIRIEVYPKIFSEGTLDFSKYQLNLLYWLSYCRKVRFPFSLVDLSQVEIDDYLELIIYIFSNHVSEILNAQPFQAYQDTTEETNYLKGRLHFENYIRQNVSTGKWQNFYCTHTPFIYDNLFNRIVKYVTRRLINVSTHSSNRQNLSSILFLLHDVSDVPVTASDCERIKLNPLFADLQNVLNLCRLILSNQMIDIKSEDSRNFCFLIPMEYVFEDFVFGFINEHWPQLPFKSQSRSFLALNDGKEVFTIRNDIYLKDQILIDTKYKIRLRGTGLKAGVNQADLYQMISYLARRSCSHGILLYPDSTLAENCKSLFTIPPGSLSKELHITIRNIDIRFLKGENPDAVILERMKEINELFRHR